MFGKKYGYYYSYAIIVVAIVVCGYLLNLHFAVTSGKYPHYDLCSAFFGKGCMVSLLSKFSTFLDVPLGGWGIIYLSFLFSLILINQKFNSDESDEIIQVAFWIAFFGSLISLYYLVLMLTFPKLFCPYCSIFHLLNFLLLFIIKKITAKSFIQLAGGLKKASGILLLGNSMPLQFNKWKWLAFIIPVFLGLSIYQWILIKNQNAVIERIIKYDPLKEIEKFENSETFEIQLTPDDPILGSVEAKISLVVFSDFQCSVCNMFASNFKNLIKSNKNKLNIRFKYFPLSSGCNSLVKNDLHHLSCESAWACESARMQGRFWEYHDSLFSLGPVKNENELFQIAKLLDLDMVKFNDDYHSEKCRNKIKKDIEEGILLNIDGTPTAFLNGKKLENLSEKDISFLIKFLKKNF